MSLRADPMTQALAERTTIPTSLVWSCNEWDPLEEVIVGNPLHARFPTSDPSTRLAEFPDRQLEEIPQGPFPQRVIEGPKRIWMRSLPS